jgi:hypothetical protein
MSENPTTDARRKSAVRSALLLAAVVVGIYAWSILSRL